jgi:iron complex outermembrane receptor protein
MTASSRSADPGSRRPGRFVSAVLAALCISVQVASAAADDSASMEDLSHLSLRELGDLEVTSASKSPEPLRRAASTIYVITHEAIVRSGATSLMEALRLAPNLQVEQLTSSNYALGARGFAGQQESQNFANKLLILIDGRSVYSPLYSGIYSDAQDVMLEDVDRIEVISGSGGTLWGANAMNGVINVITRPAYVTAGGLVSTSAGNQDQNLAVRYGDKINDEAAYRVYGMTFHRGAEELDDGQSAHDGWSKGQAGFRLDWNRIQDFITLQGDTYRATESLPASTDQAILGTNVLGRWRHQSDRSEVQIQAYYDQTERVAPAGSGGFVLHTGDVEVQQSVQLGSFQRLVWGGGERLNSYGITNAQSLLFEPTSRQLTLGDVFAEDTVSLGTAVRLSAGVKFEDDPYSGWSFLPDLRLSWDVGESAFLWAAASRGIRSPTPFDIDVIEKVGPTVFLTGNERFLPEKVTAYEIGYRGQPAATLSMSLATFYNVYNDLRTIETASSAVFLPLNWGNLMRGETYGINAWADWQVADWWRLTPGVSLLHKRLRFEPGASELLGVGQSGDDPTSQASLVSSIDLGHDLAFDANFRYVGALPDPHLRAYCDLTARVAWRVSKALELAVSGSNLLNARHQEYPSPSGEEIRRAGLFGLRWTF